MAKTDLNEPVKRGMLDEAVTTILEGMDNLYGKFKNELQNEIKPLKEDVSTLKRDVSSIKSEITFIKRGIQDIKADLSDTPSRPNLKN